MNFKKTAKKMFTNLEIGIGEVSKLSGVSQRQLRYWEEKGYIKPVNSQSGVRAYSLFTVSRIIFIKSLLDEGYTLNAACKKTEEAYNDGKVAGKFFRQLDVDIETVDAENGFGVLDFGTVKSSDGQTYKLQGKVDDKGARFEIEK